jgi:signal transduction histidine kinase
MKKNVLLVLLPVLILSFLCSLNVSRKVRWREVTDGVIWKETSGGIVAIRVDEESDAFLRAGIRKGDVLTAVNKAPVRNKIDLQKSLWIASGSDQQVIYEISRPGFQLYPSFFLQKRGTNPIYYYFVLVGLTTIVISLFVFFNSRTQLSATYFFYFLLSLAFASFNIFSPTGRLDALDMVFHFLDKAAFVAFPPLFLHFFMVFPQRKRFLRKNPKVIRLVYLPAAAFFLGRVLFQLPLSTLFGDAAALRFQNAAEKLELLHFTVFSVITLAVLVHSAVRSPTILQRKQLRMIVYGLAFGILPSTVFYAVPFILGSLPSTGAELTLLLQALIPLTFSYSISHYKIVDLEVLLKKAATLIFSFFVIAFLYFIVSSQTKLFSENRLKEIGLGVLAIILGATLFTPLKKLFQALLDRAIYRRSYEYRKTLLFISKELSRERDLHNLSHSLLEAIAKALAMKTVAVLLTEEDNPLSFRILGSHGEEQALPARMVFDDTLTRHLRERDRLSTSSPSADGVLRNALNAFTPYGFHHYLPLKIEDHIVGCLVMGKKADGSFLSREDWELLTAISGSAALALENAHLSSLETIRTREMQRLKDYSENIIESLTIGVAVIDQTGAVIGWNRVLEDKLGIMKTRAMGKNLGDLLDAKAYSALFPEEAQQDFRLLSEIPISTGSDAERTFDIAKTPLLDNTLRAYGTIIAFEDVTEKIHLQQQLLTSEKLASIGLLSAGVAHEINTPLTGISSYVQMLQKTLADSHYAQILEKIEIQTERVARIVKNLLSFSRNPSESSFQRISLKTILEEILSLMDYKLKNLNIALELDLSQVPPIYAQGERLQQVFINIILNALDAMPSGGTLRIRLVENDRKAVTRISDTGTGIKAADLPHIFDPFFTTKGIGKGTGLGLSISYAIVKEHSGQILVESEVGKGTTFTIILPMESRGPDPEKSRASESAP